jgi:hypothetical protein
MVSRCTFNNIYLSLTAILALQKIIASAQRNFAGYLVPFFLYTFLLFLNLKYCVTTTNFFSLIFFFQVTFIHLSFSCLSYFLLISIVSLLFNPNTESVSKILIFLIVMGAFFFFLLFLNIEYLAYSYGIVYASGIIVLFFFATIMISSSVFKFYQKSFLFIEYIIIISVLSNAFQDAITNLYSTVALLFVA